VARHAGTGTIRHRAYALFAMARPGFMLGMVPLYAVGVAGATYVGVAVRWPAVVLGLATVWTVQAMTHYANEYWDVGVDAASPTATALTGGSGVLVDRLVPRRTAMVAAVACLVVAVGLAGVGLWFLDAGWRFVSVVAVALAGGWAYSSPPVRLVGRGVGELAVAAISGGLVPAVAYLLQTPELDARLGQVVAPLLVLGFATSLSTALPDVAGDRAGGKRTLAVRLGHRRAVALDGLVLVVGIGAFAALVAPIQPTVGAVGLVGLLGPLALFAVSAPGAARGGGEAAERVALAGIGTLGIASVATVAVLLLG